jgi:hypothetical protein
LLGSQRFYALCQLKNFGGHPGHHRCPLPPDYHAHVGGRAAAFSLVAQPARNFRWAALLSLFNVPRSTP